MKPIPPLQIPDLSTDGLNHKQSPLLPKPANFSKANRKVGECGVQKIYPWLLCASTACAAIFCLLYITKPFILSASTHSGWNSSNLPASNNLLEKKDSTPAKPAETPTIQHADPRSSLTSQTSTGAFEETNLRIQHILTAEAPSGQLARIDLEVPVLYQSRNLRWTPEEAAAARELLNRLIQYQEKNRQLRDEGTQLLDAWNQLIEQSIPTDQLRADSPSLPVNQADGASAPRPAELSTPQAIQIQPMSNE